MQQGDLVEVRLENEDIEQGVTIHWHGVDVPNAEDGVAGVTQDAVLPGERHIYRFRAEQVGTFWYHSHQVSSKEVRRGLFGAFVIEPAEERDARGRPGAGRAHVRRDPDLERERPTGASRRRAPEPASDFGSSTRTTHRVDSRSRARRFASSRSTAPTSSDRPRSRTRPLEIAGGGRADVAFTMPQAPVWLTLTDTAVGLALNANGRVAPAAAERPEPEFDPATYGEQVATPFDASSSFDRRFELTIGRWPGFLDGRPGLQWTLNGEIFPHVPVFVVEEGDLVHMTIANDTKAAHPMHLHGHHLLVLSRDGVPISGSPWWVDTLNVEAGERYEVSFQADNPGIWMDHCHNLRHAADGLTMHVAYTGVSTPFEIGGEPHNEPE